jgi:hypothetical protein
MHPVVLGDPRALGIELCGQDGDLAKVAVGESTSSGGPGGAVSVETGGAVGFAGWKGETRGRLGMENGTERTA